MTNLLKNALFPVAILFAQIAFGQSHAAGIEAMQLEEWDKAISIYAGLVKANPADQSAFLSLGNAYLAKGDKENALANFKNASNTNSDAPLTYVANGRVLLVGKQSGRSRKTVWQSKEVCQKRHDYLEAAW
jgi:tetratricopeptide (TPR) repeat protein